MADVAVSMLQDSLDAYVNRDGQQRSVNLAVRTPLAMILSRDLCGFLEALP